MMSLSMSAAAANRHVTTSRQLRSRPTTTSALSAASPALFHVCLRRDGNDKNEQVCLQMSKLPTVLTSTCNATKLGISGCRDDWEELDGSSWTSACEAIGRVKTLTSFRFVAPYCRQLSGYYQDTRLVHLLPEQMPQLQKFVLVDGLAGYTQLFRWALPKMTELRSLCLADASHHLPLSHACSVALATVIRLLPNLTVFKLHRVRFETKDDFELVLQALVDKTSLQEVRLSNIRTVLNPSLDLGKAAMDDHPHFIELRAVTEYLRELHQSSSCSMMTMSQRLHATLHVRTRPATTTTTTTTEDDAEVKKTPNPLACDLRNYAATGTTTTTNFIDTLSMVSDRLDFIQQILRHEVDPTMWATTY